MVMDMIKNVKDITNRFFLYNYNIGRQDLARIEKRQMERFSLVLPATIYWINEDKKRHSLKQTTSNISAGGAFFKTQQPLSVGTDVKINIVLPLDKLKNKRFKGSYINVSGTVIRIDQQGMAIRFAEKFQISPITTGSSL